ncbi:polysaccharide lyase 8 family protein [uncultured Streptomyces sp.]|uniref:polysaccharide lyase 8 family protein n=1 Tax=uncultured Streptomyces sp. TaxID=174707 RepID=UPI00262EBF9B|nr:polysaccharide lyase 8 family protein [uncultured Streptomyces sp.]
MPASPYLDRRTLLAAGGSAAVLSLAPPSGAAAQGATGGTGEDEFGILLARAEELMTGGAFDPADPAYASALASLDANASALWARMNRAEDRTHLFAEYAPASLPGNFGESYPLLRSLAVAWATPGTSLTGSAEVAEELVSALRFLYDVGYNPSGAGDGNWWYWEIGAPRNLLDTCVLLRDRIPADDLAAYVANVGTWVPDADKHHIHPDWGYMTGANRSDKSIVLALQGLLGRDSAKIAQARDALSDVNGGGARTLFSYSFAGDGFYEDGSFVQHGTVAYTGSYGNVTLGGSAFVLALLGGSTWAVTDPGVTVLYDAVDRAFSPLILDGLLMDCVRGRAVSREKERDFNAATATLSHMLLLAFGAPADYAARWRALAKGWIERNELNPSLERAGIPQITRARAVLDDATIVPARRLTGHFVFADMDRVVHRRPTWALALSLSSNRIASYESLNGENIRPWYQGDGMTYLHTTDDPGQFSDAFWPTVDPCRLPGTTVDTRPRADVAPTDPYRPQPANAIAGGAVLEGRFGAAALDLDAADVTLRARKSWFTLDNVVVALGSGITSTDGRTVETVVENRNLHADGTGRLIVDGASQPGVQGWSARFDRARWAHLEGVGGYVFPQPARMRALREERTGSWRDINTGGSTASLTRRYLTLWFDHGVSPTESDYGYVLLPGLSAAATAVWSLAAPVRVVAHDSAAHAVEARRDGLTAVNFWEPGTAAGITSSGPASVLVRRAHGRTTVAVSDPGRTQDTVTVRLPFAAREVVRADGTVTAVPGRRPVVTVRTGGSRGHTHTVELS